MYRTLLRILKSNSTTGILTRFDGNSGKYVRGDSGITKRTSYDNIYRDSQEGTPRNEIPSRNQQDIRKNNGISNAEVDTVGYADFNHKKYKYLITRFSETVIHSFDYPNVIMYVKGSIRSPQMTKTLKINNPNTYIASKIKEEIVKYYEYNSNTNSAMRYVENVFGEKCTIQYTRRNFESFQGITGNEKRTFRADSNKKFETVAGSKNFDDDSKTRNLQNIKAD